MEICINYGGKMHCHFVPELELPVRWVRPGPGPIDYPPFFQDAVLLNSVRAAARHVSDDGVRQALERGCSAALKAMQERAGADVTIRETPRSQGS
jgi:hypothetical protein